MAELAVDERTDWLAQVIDAPPGAVVLDFEPAAERGWEVMRLLKASPGTQDVPVLFYSLSAGPDGGALLALDYLTKPVGSDDLARALERQGLLPAGRARRNILLVDDDPAMLDLHARVVHLHLPECRIRKAHDGREALHADGAGTAGPGAPGPDDARSGWFRGAAGDARDVLLLAACR